MSRSNRVCVPVASRGLSVGMNWWTATGGPCGPAALTAPVSARAGNGGPDGGHQVVGPVGTVPPPWPGSRSASSRCRQVSARRGRPGGQVGLERRVVAVPGRPGQRVHHQDAARRQRGADQVQELGALAAGHAVDHAAQHDRPQAGRGHGAQVVGQILAPQVRDASARPASTRSVRGSTP